MSYANHVKAAEVQQVRNPKFAFGAMVADRSSNLQGFFACKQPAPLARGLAVSFPWPVKDVVDKA